MKELLHKLLKSLGLSRRDWVVLLPALLLAFSTWLIHNLSLRYNDYITVPVMAQCNIDGHSDQSLNHCEVVARCRTTGYNVIRQHLWGGKRVRNITFRPEVMKHKGGDVFYVTSSDLMEYAHLIYGDDVTVEYFASDTLFFTFPVVDFKKVPVHPVYSVSYRSQYTGVGDVMVEPDSVTLYGEPYRLENVERVYTQPIKRSDLDADINGVIALEKIQGLRFSAQEVRYFLDVTRYVELKKKVVVEARNVPADKEMLVIPSSVEIALKCSFPLKGDPLNSVVLYVDYNDFLRSVSGKCRVRHDALPEGVIDYDHNPFYVECIVSDK